MIIAGVYSFNKGKKIIEKNYPNLLNEIKNVISDIDASKHLNKESKEITMPEKITCLIYGKDMMSPLTSRSGIFMVINPVLW